MKTVTGKDVKICFICGRPAEKWVRIVPVCEHYEGGLCYITMKECEFNEEVMCEKCLKEEGSPEVLVEEICEIYFEHEMKEEEDEEEYYDEDLEEGGGDEET